MSKKFKGKTCVYCGERPATTNDHVLSREFLQVPKRGNLPQAPACEPCNNDKSKLEHYLTAVLPFGGQHGDAASNLETMVPPRLKKNAKLHRELAQKRRTVWQKNAGGVLVPAMTLPIEPEKLERLAGYIAKGLIWHHWQVIVPPRYDVVPICLNAVGTQILDLLFHTKTANRVEGNLGDGALVYRGVQGDDPAFSYWEISLLGVVLGDDPAAPGEVSTKTGVLIGPKDLELPSFKDVPSKAPANAPELTPEEPKTS